MQVECVDCNAEYSGKASDIPTFCPKCGGKLRPPGGFVTTLPSRGESVTVEEIGPRLDRDGIREIKKQFDQIELEDAVEEPATEEND